jgi:antitoxin component of RelBE/YafQ-DinJ toxin-antitoxin module
MTDIFRCRIDRRLLAKAERVAEEIGTTPGEIVRLLFVQLVKRRSIPFPLQADPAEDLEIRSARRRSEMWDEMNEGQPSAR